MASPSSFVFHGGVFPFEARLEGGAPVHVMKGAVALPRVGGDFFEADGPWVLPAIGNFAAGRVDRVERRVSGQGDARNSRSHVSCTIEGLEVPGLLKADRLQADLTSTYVNDQHTFEESVTVEGLRIDQQDYQVDTAILDTVKGRTLAELREVRRDPHFTGHFASTMAETAAGLQPVEMADGNLACFLVQPQPLRVMSGANEMDVFVGEYSIGERQRRLTMLRIEMRPAAATATALGAPTQQGSSVVFMELFANGHKPP